MKYLNLRANNLFSFKEVEFNLNKRGLLLITGTTNNNEHNGTGKSTLTNKILSWTLFGEEPSGAKTDSVVLRGSEETIGEVTFEGIDGKEYTVKRGRKPNYLKLLQGPTDLTSRLETETQALINQKLGKTFEIFCFTDFFGRSRASEFLFLTPKSQLEIIEQILGVDKIDEYLTNIKKYETELNSILTIKNNELNKLKGSLETIRIEKLKWETYLSTLPNIDSNLKENINKLQLELQELQKELNNIQTEQLKLNNQLSSIRIKIASKSVLANKHIEESKCPECSQPINMEHYNRICESVGKAKSEIFYLNQQELEIKNQLHSPNKISNLKINYDSKFKEVNRLQSLVSQLDLKDKAIETINNNSNNIEIITNKIINLTSELDKYISEQADLSFWKKIFSKDLRNYMIEQACPYLNSRVKIHMQGLNHPEFNVNFSTVKTLKSSEEKVAFNVQVSRDTGGDGFINLSAGEKQLVSFTIALALSELAESKIQSSSNLLILDEPFCNLDSKNSESVIMYISTLSSKKETILLVSNDESLKELIPSRVNITKENGVSYVN